MSRSCLSVFVGFASILALGLIIGCSVSGGSSGGVPFVDVTIGEKTVRFTLDDAGVFRVEPGHVTRNTARVRPFESTPTDVPTSGTMLLGSEIVVSGEDSNVPVTGGFDLTPKIDGPEAPNPAETGTTVGTYHATIVDGRVVEVSSGLILPDHLLPLIATNDFTMVLEMEADFPGTITITDLQFEFGASRPTEEAGGANSEEDFCDRLNQLGACLGGEPLTEAECEEALDSCAANSSSSELDPEVVASFCGENSYSRCVNEVGLLCATGTTSALETECEDAGARLCLALSGMCPALESGGSLGREDCLSLFDVVIDLALVLCESGGQLCHTEGQPCVYFGCCGELICGEDDICVSTDGGPAVSGNVAPTLDITAPNEDLSIGQGDSFVINWTDMDRDSSAFIDFDLVAELDPTVVIPLVVGLPENDLDDNLNPTQETFEAETSLAQPGRYHLRGTIRDGINTPVVVFATMELSDTARVVVTILPNS